MPSTIVPEDSENVKEKLEKFDRYIISVILALQEFIEILDHLRRVIEEIQAETQGGQNNT